MRIAVTTPSGNVGRFVTRSLVRAGARPVLITPHPERIDIAVRPYVDAVGADLTDRRALLDATGGVEALYAVVPSTGAADPIAACGRIGENLAAAVVGNSIRRTVFQSSVGAELRHGAGEIDGLAAAEEALDDAVGKGAGVVHLRCGFFFTNLLLQLDAIRAGTVPTLWPVDHRMPWVAPRDIADVASGLLLRADWHGRHVQAVHGPEDLSWREAMAIVTRVTGRPVEAVRVPDDDMRAGLASAGLLPAQVEAIVGMAIGLRDGFVPEQGRDAVTTTDTGLDAWVQQALVPRLAASPGERETT